MIPAALPDVRWLDLRAALVGRAGLADALAERLGLNVMLTDSGTSALMLAVQACRAKRVAIPAFTCPAVYSAVLSAGAVPVPVDVEFNTLEFGPTLERADFDAVVATHLFGCPVSIRRLRERTKKVVIEDCAQGLGATIDGLAVGSQGDFAVFSFGLGKVITGGSGGALGYRAEAQETALLAARRESSVPSLMSLLSTIVGRYRLSYEVFQPLRAQREVAKETRDVAAAQAQTNEALTPMLMSRLAESVALSQLARLDEVVATRTGNAERMLAELERSRVEVATFDQERNGTSIFTRLALFTPARDRILKALVSRGYEAEVPYPMLVRLLDKFPVARVLHGGLVTVPVHHRVSDADILAMAGIIEKESEGLR